MLEFIIPVTCADTAGVKVNGGLIDRHLAPKKTAVSFGGFFFLTMELTVNRRSRPGVKKIYLNL